MGSREEVARQVETCLDLRDKAITVVQRIKSWLETMQKYFNFTQISIASVSIVGGVMAAVALLAHVTGGWIEMATVWAGLFGITATVFADVSKRVRQTPQLADAQTAIDKYDDACKSLNTLLEGCTLSMTSDQSDKLRAAYPARMALFAIVLVRGLISAESAPIPNPFPEQIDLHMSIEVIDPESSTSGLGHSSATGSDMCVATDPDNSTSGLGQSSATGSDMCVATDPDNSTSGLGQSSANGSDMSVATDPNNSTAGLGQSLANGSDMCVANDPDNSTSQLGQNLATSSDMSVATDVNRWVQPSLVLPGSENSTSVLLQSFATGSVISVAMDVNRFAKAGVVFLGLFFNVYKLVVTSIDVHHGSPSVAAEKLRVQLQRLEESRDQWLLPLQRGLQK